MNTNRFKLFAAPRPIKIPKKLMILYVAIAAAAILTLYLLGKQILAFGILAIAFCGFALMDILFDMKENPPVRRFKKIQAVLTCVLAAVAVELLIFMLCRLS